MSDPTAEFPPNKTCSKCRNDFPRTPEHFHRDRHNKDGLCARCKICAREDKRLSDLAYRDKRVEYHRRYYIDHSEKLKQSNRLWHTNNRQEANQRSRQWYSANPDKARENKRRWIRDNPEKHREVRRAKEQRRRARKHNAEGTHTAADIQAQYERQNGRCYYCGLKVGKKYHVDHVTPLSRGGSDGPENLVVTCGGCNLRKNDKLPHEWPEGGRLL